MVLRYQAFLDESHSSHTDEEFVLGGYVQTAEVWASFAHDWELQLPFGVKDKYGKLQFHMTEMKERMSDVKLFSDVIDKHNLLPVSFRMNLPNFRRAISIVEERFQLHQITVGWERWNDPYYFSFRHFLDQFHVLRSEPDMSFIVPPTEKIDFYFDRRSEQVPILEAWSVVRATMSEEEEARFGENPRFENKQDFLGLQAADFWAWWVRKWYEEDDSEIPTKLRSMDFGTWRGKKRPCLVTSISEEYIVEALTVMTLDNMAQTGGPPKPHHLS
jgi:hypothetical protein